MAQHSFPFRSLSIKDLLDARDAYHIHLRNLENVVGTAIGLYRIRLSDADAKSPGSEKFKPDPKATSPGPRTLENTVVRPWSWPCVLVFVSKWEPPGAFAKSPQNYIPPRLYLPDGRVVPTCVLYVEQATTPETLEPALLRYPSNLVGGGYPALVEAQGQTRLGTLGCVVTDGQRFYALTNRHVAGPQGQPVATRVGADSAVVGATAERQVGRVPFTEAYPDWPGYRTEVNLDAALVELDDVEVWTTQVLGTAQMGDIEDLNTDTMGLWLIGQQVKAFGGASGDLAGEIHALFYRYRTLAGVDEVADFLIGPRQMEKTPLLTRPGDSGTVWFLESAEGPKSKKTTKEEFREIPPPLKPFALQWGGHELNEGNGTTRLRFALASNLTNVCRALDVEVLRDWNSGRPNYWGTFGHYTIGAFACELISDSKLFKLMKNNLERISFNEADIRSGQITPDGFFPLADVPDTVWKVAPHKRAHEGPNHFADMDEKAPDGSDLFQISSTPAGVTPRAWDDFYKSIGKTPKNRGLLPFRVWQLYAEMVKAAKEGNTTRFVALGGVMAHYVGDSCQPLHASRLHDGTPGVPEEAGVHSAYETKMVKRFIKELFDGLKEKVGNKKAKTDVRGGHEAAQSVVALMREVRDTLAPETIIASYVARNHSVMGMWEDLEDATTKVVALGCLRLASLWQSAWVEGDGRNTGPSKLKAIPLNKLRALYESPQFAPSLYLPELLERPELLP